MVIDWCGVSFQNIVVIPDMFQVGKLRFQFRQLCLLIINLLFQRIIFRCKLFQRRQLSIVKGVDRLGFLVLFDFLPMLLIEFRGPPGFPILNVNLFRPAVIPDCFPLPIDLLHPILLSPE